MNEIIVKGESERNIVVCVKLWHEEEAYNTSERLQRSAASTEFGALVRYNNMVDVVTKLGVQTHTWC